MELSLHPLTQALLRSEPHPVLDSSGIAISRYADVAHEYRALTSGCGIADVSWRSRISLSGKDRAKFLHGLCTNDILSLKLNQGCEAMILDARGHVQAFFHVFCLEDELCLHADVGQAARIIPFLEKYLIREEVVLTDQTPLTAAVLVQGVGARELLAKLQLDDPPDAGLTHRLFQIAGGAIRVASFDWAGPTGYLLWGEIQAVQAAWQRLRQNGAIPCGKDAVEICRVEALSPAAEREIGAKTLPQELMRDKSAISFKKGCYLGQETVARIDALGHVNRVLVCVRIEGTPAQAGFALQKGGQEVGTVTSVVNSPKFGGTLGLAFVRRPLDAMGTELESSAGKATVVLSRA